MRKKFANVGVFVATAILMLMTCEIATRTFVDPAKNLTLRDKDVGRRYRPNMDRYIYNWESNGPIIFQTHQLGFRGKSLTEEKRPGVRRIVVVGDSYTASEALTEGQTFCHVLGESLKQQQPDEQWEVLNFGVPGSGTGQEFALYRNEIKDLKPDAVIVGFGNATDLRDNSYELGRNPTIRFKLNDKGEVDRIPLNDTRLTFSNYLNANSRFYFWQKRKVNSLLRHIRTQSKNADGRHLILASEEPAAYTRAWEITAGILREFRRECSENGTQLLVVAIPSAVQVYQDLFEESKVMCDNSELKLNPMHPDNRLISICGEIGIPFLSLVDTFDEQTPSKNSTVESEHLFLGGMGHLNTEGSKIIGSELCDWILENDLVPKHSPGGGRITRSDHDSRFN